MSKRYNPMPTIEFDGEIYKLKSRITIVPDLNSMERLAALIWINQNTTKRGYQKPANPLRGMGDVITI